MPLIDRLTDHVWLGDAGDALAMAHAGATVLLDLRGETEPPALSVRVEHFPLQDLTYGQHAMVRAAARRIKALVDAGETVGVYCQAGISRTAAVAIAYLMLEGQPLPDATRRLRTARPQALPAVGLMQILEDLERDGGVDPWRHVEVNAAGVRVHAVHQPARGPGPALVLLHGAYGSWTHWIRNLDSLDAFGDVYALDLPGFGESDDAPSPFTYPGYLTTLAAAVRALTPGPVVVGGYSFGAALAARLLDHDPAVAEALLLVSLVGRTGDPATHHRVEERHFVTPSGLEDRLGVVRDNLRHWHLADPRATDEATVRLTYLNILRTRLVPRRLRTEAPPPPTLDVLRRLSAVPVLFVWGEHDAFCQPSVAAWREACLGAVPHAEAVVLTGAAHWCQYEQPDAFAAAVGPFVGRLAARTASDG